MQVILVILGVIVFLAMEHPVALWLVFVPLVALFLLSIVGWLKDGRAQLSGLMSSMFIFGAIILALLFVCSN